jgi:hypothetical protein
MRTKTSVIFITFIFVFSLMTAFAQADKKKENKKAISSKANSGSDANSGTNFFRQKTVKNPNLNSNNAKLKKDANDAFNKGLDAGKFKFRKSQRENGKSSEHEYSVLLEKEKSLKEDIAKIEEAKRILNNEYQQIRASLKKQLRECENVVSEAALASCMREVSELRKKWKGIIIEKSKLGKLEGECRNRLKAIQKKILNLKSI